MSNNNILLEKIDNVSNLDSEQILYTNSILNLCNLIQTNSTVALPDISKQKLLDIIKKQLQTSNSELQKNTLILLCHCYDLNVFNKEQLVNELLLILIDGVFKKKQENLEDQELWLKALDTLLKFAEADLIPIILKHSIDILEAIKLALTSKVNSSPKKLKALKMLGDIISNIDLDENNTSLLLSILFTILIPSLFNEDTKHFKIILDMAYKIIIKIPFSKRAADPNWTTFTRTQFVMVYVPFMEKMVMEDKLMYCPLWKFCLKLLESDIHTKANLTNKLLQVLEKAFKAKNMNLRKEAFIFWKDFIRCYFSLATEKMKMQKISLLMIPLTTSISKTKELFSIKYETWCILLNTIYKLKIYSEEFPGILAQFLDLFSALTIGAKLSDLGLKMCENYFKIIASESLLKKYTPAMNYDVCVNEMLDTTLFLKLHEKVIECVEKASVLLNCLENDNEAELNRLIWEAFFNLCENAYKNHTNDFNQNILHQVHDLVSRVTDVSQSSKQKISAICIEKILNLIVSDKYDFCKEKHNENTLFELVYTKLFFNQDPKALYMLSNVPIILQLIFQYKENDLNYLTTIETSLEQIDDLSQKNSTDQELITNLFKSWEVIGATIIKLFTKNNNSISTDLITIIFSNLMVFALQNIHHVDNSKKIVTVWKSNLESYCSFIGEDGSINSLCATFVRKFNIGKTFDSVSSDILYFMISKLCFKRGIDEDNRKELTKVVLNLKQISTKVNLSGGVVTDLKKCVEFIFLKCQLKTVMAKLLPMLTFIVKNLLKINPELDFTDTMDIFVNSYKPTDRMKPLFQDLIKAIYKNKKPDRIFELLENEMELDKNDSICPKTTEKLVVDGVDINTMTPIKVKGSILNNIEKTEITPPLKKITPPPKPLKGTSDDDFIFVATPYKFNPKKLTEMQKEKLARRRDDIPAMYNDLSRSQTMEFSDSNSNIEPIPEKIPEPEPTQESDEKRAFSEISDPNIENKKPETEEEVDPRKKRRQELELKKLTMSNKMGFDEHLKNLTLENRAIRNRILTSTSSNSPTKRKRGRPRRQESPNTDLKTQSTPDLLSSQENVNESEEIKNIQIKLNVSDLPEISAKVDKSEGVLKVMLKPRKIERRNSLESANLIECSEDTDLLSLVNKDHIRKRRHSFKDVTGVEDDCSRKVPKIKLLRSPNEEKSFIIENKLELIVEAEEVPSSENTVNENEKETESVNSDMFNDIRLNMEEYPNANNSICRKVLFENNTDSDETTLDSSTERLKSPSKEPVIQIATSPIQHDTPTRNKEFLDDTLEISPIKNTTQRKINLDVEKVDEKPTSEDGDKSPDLFSSDNSGKEVIISECSTPVITKQKNKFSSKGRIAQMMNLINPNGIKINEITTPTKDEIINSKSEVRVSTPIVSNSRISKMMVQFDNNKHSDKIEENVKTPSQVEPSNEEMFLKFTKNIPPPTASPRYGILRKRKHPDEHEEGISPCAKKKRVNFNDPPASSILIENYLNVNKNSEKFEMETTFELKENSKWFFNKKKITIVDNEIQDIQLQLIETETNAALISETNSTATEPNENNTDSKNNEENYIIESESSSDEKIEIETPSSEEKTEPSENSVYKKLFTCSEPLSKCLNQTAQNEKLISELKEQNITTMGDFAKYLMDDPEIPITMFVEVKNMLDSHNCDDHLFKPMKKIKPTTLSSPKKLKKITSPQKSNSEDFVSQSTPTKFNQNISSQEIFTNDSQGKSVSILMSDLPSLTSICATETASGSDSFDWNKLFCSIIGTERVLQLLLQQESSRDTNFVSIIKFILNYNPQKFFGTVLEIISKTKSFKNEFQNKFLPAFLKICNINCVRNSLTLTQIQDLFISRLKLDYEMKALVSFNSTELFDSILRFSPNNIQSFIPNILQNPAYNSCIIENLSLLELQEHLIERLTKDSDNKDMFLSRLNKRLGNKLKIVQDSDEIISDSLESNKTSKLKSSLDLIKSLNSLTNEDRLLILGIIKASSDLLYSTHINGVKT